MSNFEVKVKCLVHDSGQVSTVLFHILLVVKENRIKLEWIGEHVSFSEHIFPGAGILQIWEQLQES